MMKQFRSGLLAVAAVLSVVALLVPSAGAQGTQNKGKQTANGFRVSPVRSEYVIDKGKSETLTITVENPTDIPTVAQIVVNDFVAGSDESGSPRLIMDDNTPLPRNSFKALVGQVGDVALGPREKKEVAVKIAVPANANAGGYYGAVRFIPTDAGKVASGTNVGLTASVGTIVLVTVPGNLVQKIDLVQLTAAQGGKPKTFMTKGDVSVLTRLKNTGDIHSKPFGRVEVKSMSGKLVASYEFNNIEPRANILPDSTRRFENPLNKKNWFGRYTINMYLGYEQGSGDLVMGKATFWYIPQWALYALLGLILIIALAIFLLIRRSQGKKALLRVRLRRKKR